jgi:secreted trypsin-like serine protease
MVLRISRNKVISNEECEESFGNFVRNATLCLETESTGSSSCRADHGGPVTWQENENSERFLIGAVSYGVWLFNFGCDPTQNDFMPTGNTRLTEFVDWINFYIK